MNFARRKSRRAVAGIIATVIMFAILFTVGASYFIFVSAENATYVQSLLSATSKLQGGIQESLSVNTLLEPNGDLGFVVNDTSALTVNMTGVLVISSTGALLKCDGVGFPAGAGCANSTPSLWMTLNAGNGSPDIDTGYVYSQGTTDTIKVLSARGNTYTGTYPEPAVGSSSSQSVAVNLDNLKWVQLLPQSSSLKQHNYVSNCNSANCAATFGSSVTAGNILVDGIGWANQPPPSSPPSDTLHDSFVLGASSSVTTTASPALVQHKYTANCNAASCGLAFSSNVGSGDTLVYAVGWSNQNTPTTPTDTRGDTFTLGASSSVAVNPISPSLVQHRYLANCNSATCSLAYPGSVTSGNTLVYGLGWQASQPYAYAPLTIQNCQLPCSGISIDSSTSNECSSARTCSATVTTSNSPDVIYVSLTDSKGGNALSSFSDSAGLTWNLRQSTTQSTFDLYTYYAIASTLLNSDSITFHTSGGATTLTINAIAIMGANTASPFDPNVSTAPTNTGSSVTSTVAVTTTNPKDLIIGANWATNTISSGAATYTSVICCTGGLNAGLEWKVVASAGSNTPTFTISSSGAWGEIGDAIQAAPSSATPAPFQELVSWNPSTYSSNEASDLGNVRFCLDTACVTPLNAWLESCSASCSPSATSAVAWVKLTSAIPAGGSTTIYMVFKGTSVEFDGVYWGEAPNLSPTYAQYDNGANVFNAYFNGNTATSSFSIASGYTLAKATGVTYGSGTISALQLTGYGSSYSPMVFNVQLSNAATVVESNFDNFNPATDSGAAALVDNVAAASVLNGVGSNQGYNSAYFNQDYLTAGAATVDVNPQGTASSAWLYASEYYQGSSATSNIGYVAPQLYSTSGGYTGTVNVNPISAASHLYLGFLHTTTSSYAANVDYNWGRARASPPSGVMPTPTLGGLVTGTGVPISVSDTLGNSFTQGASQPVTGGSSTYESAIWYATAASSGSDTITATFSAAVAGSVSIFEMSGYTATGLLSSTGSSSTGSTAASVSSLTPASNSIVIGNLETGSALTKYTVGSGYVTIASGSTGCDASDASQGCNEYETGLGSATVTPFTLSAATPWTEVALAFAPLPANTYYSYIWYATAASSGADTISASFSAAVTGSVSIFELSGVTATGLLSSTGSSSVSQLGASVTSMTPTGSSMLVIGNTETTPTTYTAGSGYTLAGTCNSVTGCGEYQLGLTSATTVPMSLSSSAPWVEVALGFSPITTNYYSYIWYAPASASGTDTITTGFTSTVAGSESIYEITGYTTSGALFSSGNSIIASTSATVTPFNPTSDSFIVGNAEGATGSNTFTASAGFTLAGSCSSVGGCGEYDAGGGGSTNSVPMTLSTSAPWTEAAMSFSTPFNPQSGIQVGGYPTMGVAGGVSIAWEVTFTNVDPSHRSITIWPQTLLAIGSAEFDGFDTDYTQDHYYIVDSLNAGSTTVNGYTSTTGGTFLTLSYNIPTTLFFSSTKALGSITQAFGTNYGTPFQAYFALTGVFSDGTLFGETIPYPYGIITESNAATTPTVGATATTVTVKCTSPCYFNDNSKAMVGWINSAGVMTQLTTFTTTATGTIPAGVTFQVPTASAGYYTIEVTDYINTVFTTFQHT